MDPLTLWCVNIMQKKKNPSTYRAMDKLCRQQIDVIFLIFPRKQDSTFDTYCEKYEKYFKISSAEIFTQYAKH